MGKSCGRQCFVDWHLLDHVQQFFGVDAQGLSFLRVCLKGGLLNSLCQHSCAKPWQDFCDNAHVPLPCPLVSRFKQHTVGQGLSLHGRSCKTMAIRVGWEHLQNRWREFLI